MDLDLSPKMVVREVMSSPVVAIKENNSVVEAAKIMSEQQIGAIIVNSPDGQPVGIVTERDLLIRVIAKDTVPRSVKVKDIMTTPLQTVDAETSLEDAMTTMEKLDIRRLGVTYKGRLEGVISNKDILRIMPALIEIAKERSRIEGGNVPVGPSLVGYCDQCNIYSTNLRSVNGEFLCEDCRAES